MSEGPYSIEAAMFDSTMQLHWFAVIVEGSKVGCVCEVTTEGEATKCCDELNRIAAQRDKLLAAFNKYAHHLSECDWCTSEKYSDECTCGLRAAIADVEKQQ